MDVSGTRPRPTACDAVPSGLGKSITGDIRRATVRSRRQGRRALQRAKKTEGKKERRNRRMATRVRTLEDGQYRLFNILKEIQEWWEAQAIVAVIGQETNVDSEEVDLEAMQHEDGVKVEREEVSQRLRAERLVFSEVEHGDIEVEEVLAAADDCEYNEIEVYATSERWEEAVPIANKTEGGMEWEGAEDFEVMVDAAVGHEAMSGMVRVMVADMKTELESLLRRVQGVEVNTYTSMSKFDRRLQEIEVLHSASWTRTLNSMFLKPVISNDSADTVVPSVGKGIDRKEEINEAEEQSRSAATVEHADGADRRALPRGLYNTYQSQQSELSGTTDGASRSMGRGGGAEKSGRGKDGCKGGGDGEQADNGSATAVEHADGADRRALQQSRRSGIADRASRSKGLGGGEKKGGKGKMSSGYAKVEQDSGDSRRADSKWAHFTEPSETTAGASQLRWNGRCWEEWNGRWWVEQTGEINRRDRLMGDTDGASRSTGRGEKKMQGGKK